jgi:ribonuclease Z
LVNGKPVTLPDGRLITPEQVLGPERPGTRFALVGDTGRTDNLVEHCQEADLLVIEATYLEDEAEMAHNFSHLTARQSAQLAMQAGVKNLVLTHLSRRYRERDVLAEAETIFPGVRVARDFDAYQVRRGEFVKVDLQAQGDGGT